MKAHETFAKIAWKHNITLPTRNVRLPSRQSRALPIEEIEAIAERFKEGLTGECERCVRRSDNAGALAAIYGKEYIDRLVYEMRLAAGAQLGLPPRAKPIRLLKPK